MKFKFCRLCKEPAFVRPCSQCFPQVITEVHQWHHRSNPANVVVAWKMALLDYFDIHGTIEGQSGTGHVLAENFEGWKMRWMENERWKKVSVKEALEANPSIKKGYASNSFVATGKLLWYLVGHWLFRVLTYSGDFKQ